MLESILCTSRQSKIKWWDHCNQCILKRVYSTLCYYWGSVDEFVGMPWRYSWSFLTLQLKGQSPCWQILHICDGMGTVWHIIFTFGFGHSMMFNSVAYGFEELPHLYWVQQDNLQYLGFANPRRQEVLDKKALGFVDKTLELDLDRCFRWKKKPLLM